MHNNHQPDPIANNQFSAWAIFVFILIMVLFWILLSRLDLRLDESQTLWQISHSQSYMLDLISRDVHVPLYHILVRAWFSVFGNLDLIWGRGLSLFFAVLSVPSAYFLGKTAGGQRAGIFTAGLTALSPFLQWYSSEMRMYSLVFFLATLHQLFFLKFLASKNFGFYGGLLLLTAVAGIYTHYFFWFLLVAEIGFLFWERKVYLKEWRFMFLIFMLSLLCLAPWINMVIFRQNLNNATPLLIYPTAVDVFNTFAQFVSGYQDLDLQKFFLSLWPILMVIVFGLLLKKNALSKIALIYPGFVIVLTFSVALVISWVFRPVFTSRYLTVALPSFYLLTAWLIVGFSKKNQVNIASILSVIFLAFSSFQVFSSQTPAKEDFSQAARLVSESAKPNDLVLISAPFTIYPFEYEYTGSASIDTVPSWDRFAQENIPAFTQEGLIKQIENGKKLYNGVWLVVSYDQGYEKNIVDYLNNNFEKKYEKKLPGSQIGVYYFKLK